MLTPMLWWALAHASPVDLALGEAVHDLALSPDGAHLAVADDGLLAIRDAKTLRLVWAPVPHADRWRRVVWLDDDTVQATHVSGATYAFDVSDRSIEGRPTQRPLGSGNKERRLPVLRIAARPHDILKTYDHQVRSGFPLLPAGRTPTVWSAIPTMMDYGKEGTFVGDDAGVVHTLRDGALVSSAPLGDAIGAILPTSDRTLVLTEAGTVLLLDGALEVQVRSRGPLDEPADAILLDPTGRFAWIGRPKGGLARLDLKRGRVLAEQPAGAGHRDVSTRGATVLTVEADAASLWDTASGRRLWTLDGMWSQGVQLGGHSVLLAPEGHAIWVDPRGRTTREACLTVDCDRPRPAFLAVSEDDRIVVLEPSHLLSLREMHPGRISVLDGDGAPLQSRTIEHVIRERPRLGDRELHCGQRPISNVLDLFPSNVVDMDFGVHRDVVLCDLRLSLDTLEVVEDLYRHVDETFVGLQDATELTLEGGSTVGRSDRLWVRPDDGDRYLLVDPDRQARLESMVRWDQGRLVVVGVGPTAAGGLLRYTDLSPYTELPPVERPPPAVPPEPPVEPFVVDARPTVPPDVRTQSAVEGPAGRLTWRNGKGCTPPTDEAVRTQAPAAFGPPPVHTVDTLDVQGQAIDGHAFPEHLATIDGWLKEGLAASTLVERIEGLGLKAKVKRATWTVGGSGAEAAFEGADDTWQPRLDRPLWRTWVRRGPSSEGRADPRRPSMSCRELLIDDVPKGSFSLARGMWVATDDGFLYVSDVPLYIDADGAPQPERPVVEALGHHHLGTAGMQPGLHLGAAIEGGTLVVRLPQRLIRVDLESGTLREHVARGGFKLLLVHDGVAWVQGGTGEVVGYGPDGGRHAALPKLIDSRGGGIRQLWIHEGALWGRTGADGSIHRRQGDAWQPVVVEAP